MSYEFVDQVGDQLDPGGLTAEILHLVDEGILRFEDLRRNNKQVLSFYA